MTEFVAVHHEKPRAAAIATTDLVHPERLSEAERGALSAQMLPLIQQIFDGPWLQGLADGIAKGGLGRTTLQRFFNAEGQCVGFAALFLDEFEQEGEPWSVFRGFAGLLPEYRKRQSIMRFYFSQMAPYMLRHPRRRMYFFAPIVHVSSFRVVARVAPEMYPHPERPLTPEIQQVMVRLGERYGCKPVEGEHPLVCRRAAWVRQGPGTAGRPAGEGDAVDRLFQELNPRVGDGLCVITLVPLSASSLPGALLRLGRTQVAQQLKRLRRGLTEAVA